MDIVIESNDNIDCRDREALEIQYDEVLRVFNANCKRCYIIHNV
jgi:hypothetical protein